MSARETSVGSACLRHSPSGGLARSCDAPLGDMRGLGEVRASFVLIGVGYLW